MQFFSDIFSPFFWHMFYMNQDVENFNRPSAEMQILDI